MSRESSCTYKSHRFLNQVQESYKKTKQNNTNKKQQPTSGNRLDKLRWILFLEQSPPQKNSSKKSTEEIKQYTKEGKGGTEGQQQKHIQKKQ